MLRLLRVTYIHYEDRTKSNFYGMFKHCLLFLPHNLGHCVSGLVHYDHYHVKGKLVLIDQPP